MYRFDADNQGNPIITWREPYDAGTHVKEGQTDIGSGTTPTLMGKDYVTITDNGQPRMHVLVYHRDNGQLVCAEPVFQPGQASNENSLIATDKSIIVENNFGYKDPRKDTTAWAHHQAGHRSCRRGEWCVPHGVDERIGKHSLGSEQDVAG